ncbi:helix-turn-helix transcriptional regulator [Chitinophaga defluvii]|uniref:AraC family transcriptional regulator n=1 Tax=Chitinophaga defluvii TaxID=3163343 RepID=A0ABV2SZM8_9BACT
MAVVITNDSNDVLFQEEITHFRDRISSGAIVEKSQEVKHSFGEASVREVYFEGIHIAYGAAQVNQNIHIEHSGGGGGTGLVGLLFVEQGNLVTNIDGVVDDFRFSSLEHNLLYNPNERETADVEKQNGMQFFGFSFTTEKFLQLAENSGPVLDKLANNIAGNKATFLNNKKNQLITPRMQMVMGEVRNCQFQGGLKKLFLQSKAMEILALQCEQYERAEMATVKSLALLPADVERIYFAREILIANAQNPPMLCALARQAGLNEFKLKAGFKKIFNNTVFGYLNDHRLEQARQLVLQGMLPLAQIADDMGYSSPQHFSNAFRRKFGVSPGKMR